MFKKIKALLCALVLLVGGVCLTSFRSDASAFDFYVSYAEPAKSETQGYINVLAELNGNYSVYTYFWNIIAVKDGVVSPVSMGVYVDSTDIRLCPYGSFGSTGVYFNVVEISSSSGVYSQKHSSSSAQFTYSLGPWGYTIVGISGAGNIGDFSSSVDDIDFRVNFNEDGSAMLLMDIISLLQSSSSIDSSILSTVTSILNSVDGVENQLSSVISYLQSVDSKLSSIFSQLQSIYNKADEILNEQKETNNCLEKIYNFFAEKDEKDKEAATQVGNQSTADIDNMIQDDSAGFVDSLGGLTSSMSYTGTNCSWTFPTVKLPAISGVMDEVTLIKEQEIDFTYWVNSIPSGILLLIQSVCTVALIVFCFKELYGAISYALTLKGGGNE